MGLREIGREAIEPPHLGKGKDFEDAFVRSGAQLGMMVSMPTYPVPFGELLVMSQYCSVQRLLRTQSEDPSVGSVASPSASEG